MQVQVLLRLYTSLLPHLRQAALQARPSWAGEPTLPDDSTPDGAHDALHATIKREAAAVLNIGRTLHSEGMQQITFIVPKLVRWELLTHAPLSLTDTDDPLSTTCHGRTADDHHAIVTAIGHHTC